MDKARNVLIIDDDRQAAENIRTGLEGLGYQVTLCESGEEAIRCTGEKVFDFIITDYDMPGMKGLDVVKVMRQRFPRAYVIGVSRSDLCDAFLFAGANWFIHKPVTPQKLQTIFGSLRRIGDPVSP